MVSDGEIALDHHQYFLQGLRGRPVCVFLNIFEANRPVAVDVRVVYACAEGDTRRVERVVLADLNFKLKRAPLVWRVGGPLYEGPPGIFRSVSDLGP